MKELSLRDVKELASHPSSSPATGLLRVYAHSDGLWIKLPSGDKYRIRDKRVITREIYYAGPGYTIVTEDGVNQAMVFVVPEELDGYNLTGVYVAVGTGSSSGGMAFMIHNITQTADMIQSGNKITIDVNENHSKDDASQPVIDTANDDVNWNDRLRIDCDDHGTGAVGPIFVEYEFTLP